MDTLRYSLLLSLLLLFLFSNVQGAQQDYDGWSLANVVIPNQAQLDRVKSLKLDVWSGEGVLRVGSNDIRVNDSYIMWFYGINAQVQVSFDIQNEVDRERQEQGLPPSPFGVKDINEWFNTYKNYSLIVKFLSDLASGYPSLVTYSSIGTTYEGRAIPVVKIASKTTGQKQKILVIGGEQARAWMSPSVVVYIAHQLATLYGYDNASNPSSVTYLLNHFEVHLIPVANPDGYMYSWGTSRLWRKNRRPNSDGSYGVDLNKNWDAPQWKNWCTSAPSTDTYCGTAPFSEKETSAIRDYAKKNNFSAAVQFSGYGQQVLYPYGYTTVASASNAALKKVADGWAAAIATENQITYSSLPAYSAQNFTGSARDWLFSSAGVSRSYTVELRDDGTYGFLVPVSQILPTCKENFVGFKYFAQSLQK